MAQLKAAKPPKPPKPAKAEEPPTPEKPPERPKGPSKAALKRITELEARLQALEADHARATARLAKERAALDRRAKALDAERAAKRQKLEAALSAARQAPG